LSILRPSARRVEGFWRNVRSRPIGNSTRPVAVPGKGQRAGTGMARCAVRAAEIGPVVMRFPLSPVIAFVQLASLLFEEVEWADGAEGFVAPRFALAAVHPRASMRKRPRYSGARTRRRRICACRGAPFSVVGPPHTADEVAAVAISPFFRSGAQPR